MTIRPLVILPDAMLRQASAPVGAVTPEIRRLADDMLETMYDAPGIGLAAVQVGELKRLLVLDVVRDEGVDGNPMIFIDPEITWKSEEANIYREGCLSIPEYYEEVERPAQVRVRYRDIHDKMQEIEADGLLATCLQHEIDHLNGVLFIDYLSKLKRDRVNTKFAKLARQMARG
ncbi:peptide deformylase [Camelimonas lactis]|uniref:Peptide deformylase n=1 Tax=Camelimonas lactis TaxID=659006 RepID=A0A4R2GQ37_9HYPH|nr:peptide deformylase [Camelimonas lactis]TCO11441.1 peptide deformylase [Camelimonas lactis]